MKTVLEFQSTDPPNGPLRFAVVPWDSETLEIPCLQLECDPAAADELEPLLRSWIAGRGRARQLVVARAAAESPQLLKAYCLCGFLLIETMLEIELPLPAASTASPRGIALRASEPDDLAELQRIAGTVFEQDRFHLDRRLPRGVADARMRRWIQHALDAQDPLTVFVSIESGRVIGFFHYRSYSATEMAVILLAIDREYQALGMAEALFASALAAGRSHGFQVASSHVSINNSESLNVAAALGARVRRAYHTLHWFPS